MNIPYPEFPPRASGDKTSPTEDAAESRPSESEAAQPVAPNAGLQQGMTATPMGNAPLPGEGSPSPLRWPDLFFLVLFNVVSGVAITLIVTGIAMYALRISFAELQESTGVAAAVAIVAQALLSGATLAFLYVLVRGRTLAPFWSAVGWHAFGSAVSRAAVAGRYALGGFALAVVVGILGRFVGTPSSPVPFEQLLRSRPSVLLLMGLGILVAPFVEETVFRGCIYPIIAGRFGVAVGVIATGTVFGLVHAVQLGFMWGQVSLLVLVGIVFTYVRARAGTVAASYFVHLGYNTTLFTLFYWATGGLRNLPGS